MASLLFFNPIVLYYTIGTSVTKGLIDLKNIIDYPSKKVSHRSGCSPVNRLSHTRRNLTTEHLNLNFASRTKLPLSHSFYAEKVFISCIWLIPFPECVPRPSLFDTDTFAVFKQIGNRRYFQLVEKKKIFCLRKCKESS